MRLTLALPFGLALALAPDRASADPPRVELRLEYLRGAGGEACPAEPTSLRAEVAARMGYDPFEGASAPDRLAVVMLAKGRGYAARVERFNAAGLNTWSETFSPRASQRDCAALMSPLASYLRALFLTYQAAPAAPPVAPPPEPAIPPAAPPPEPAAPASTPPPAPPARPANPPEPPNIPNPSRTTGRGVAIVAYAVGGAFLGLGIGWSVDGQNKANAARALVTQFDRAGGTSKCQSAAAPGSYCSKLLEAWQTSDAALSLRNGWFAAAGVSVAIGVAATVWTLSLPTMIKGQPQTQVNLRPGGLVFSSSF
jgi:pyruvate/2-oxoglutarate dehydrogenase complex dihydrolipoamide acyltransferase (E2) component